MPDPRPPSIDPVAASRWQRRAPAQSPWLHEEIGRRMHERLGWIRLQPSAWADWDPVLGGREAHRLVAGHYPDASAFVVEPEPARRAAAEREWARPWWKPWAARTRVVERVPDGAVQMVWANMALHFAADPQALIGQWHRALASDGFLMFSCLGPDSLRELRRLYAELGWPPGGPEFTDMHDWGDMLVQAGFAEPVMDMERITLTWAGADPLLAELRELGANVHPARFPGLRGRRWRQRLGASLAQGLAGPDGRLALSFEVVYGHALKPAARVRMAAETAFSLEDMRGLLRGDGGRT